MKYRLKNTLAYAAVVVALQACQTVAVAPNTHTPANNASAINEAPIDQITDSSELLKRANRDLQRWYQSKVSGDLLSAHNAYKRGLTMHPDDVNFQHGYYASSYTLTLAGVISHAELQRRYEQLDPAVLPYVSSPVRLGYYLKYDKSQNTGLKPSLDTLTSALKQAPQDDYLWLNLADQAQEAEAPLLAMASAQKAIDIAPENKQARYFKLQASYAAAEKYECTNKAKDIYQALISQHLALLKDQPKNKYHNRALSKYYGLLGLAPLAKRYATLAIELEARPEEQYLLAQSEIKLGNYQAANTIAEALLQKQQNELGLPLLFLTAFNKGQLDRASDYAKQYLALDTQQLDNHLVALWLLSLSSDTPLSKLISAYSTDVLSATLKDYLSQPSSKALAIASQANQCEQLYPHFASAIMLYQQGQKQAAERHLQQASALKVYGNSVFDVSTAALKQLSF